MRGQSIDNIAGGASSIQLGSLRGTSQSLIDQVSVRSIMETCSETIGKETGANSFAKKEFAELVNEKERTDDAMERLVNLFAEYTEQFIVKKPNSNSSNEAKVRDVREFLKKFRVDMKKQKSKTIFLENKILDDEKSIDMLMRDELHNEGFMNRCFESANELKKQITLVGRSFRPKKSKRTKNPIFWKPDPLRYSKHMQELFDTGLYT